MKLRTVANSDSPQLQHISDLVAMRRARRNREAPRVSVVVPTRNEASNLPLVFSRMPSGVHEVLVVDGRSTDGTVEVARTLLPDARVIQQTGRGKGDALALGFLHATGDIIVTLDADGSADPAEIPRFVAALLAGADFAKGSRFIHGGGSADITIVRSLGNKALCAVANHAFGARFTDLCYGYNAFWIDCLDQLGSPWPWFGDRVRAEYGVGFEVETVINVRSLKSGLIVWEVPSYECRRLHGASNLHAVRDGLRIVRTLWRESPGRAARSARLDGSPVGMREGILPTVPLDPVLVAPVQASVVVPEPRRGEPVPIVAVQVDEADETDEADEADQAIELPAGADHAR